MALGHMSHLVRDHGRDLGIVVGEGEQAAGHVDPSGRQGEGVDRRGIEDREPVGDVGSIGLGGEPLHQIVEIAFGGAAAIGAAIGRDQALVLALGRRGRRDDDGRFLRQRADRRPGRRRADAGHVAGRDASAQGKGERQRRRRKATSSE